MQQVSAHSHISGQPSHGGRKASIHSQAQIGSVSESHLSKPSGLGSNERQDHLMQAVLLLLKELEPSELELVKRDIDKKIVGMR